VTGNAQVTAKRDHLNSVPYATQTAECTLIYWPLISLVLLWSYYTVSGGPRVACLGWQYLVVMNPGVDVGWRI